MKTSNRIKNWPCGHTTSYRQAGKQMMSNLMKITTILIFVLMVSLNGYSQKVNFGISYGVNVSWWRGGMDLFANQIEQGLSSEGIYAEFHEAPRLGINFGFTLNYKPVKWLIIQPEVNYINEGTRLKGTCNLDGIDINMRIALNVNYLHIPVMFKFITPGGLYVAAGPFADITTHSRMKVTVSAMGESDSEKEKLPNVSRFNYGLAGGVGYQTKELGVQISYLHGLKPVFAENGTAYQLKNSVIEVKMISFFGN